MTHGLPTPTVIVRPTHPCCFSRLNRWSNWGPLRTGLAAPNRHPFHRSCRFYRAVRNSGKTAPNRVAQFFTLKTPDRKHIMLDVCTDHDPNRSHADHHGDPPPRPRPLSSAWRRRSRSGLSANRRKQREQRVGRPQLPLLSPVKARSGRGGRREERGENWKWSELLTNRFFPSPGVSRLGKGRVLRRYVTPVLRAS